jgi:hypothetical protein
MFDEVRCRYPLPLAGAADIVFQTKDTPSQGLDLYEIREGGSLWVEEYDTEDRSDPNAEGLMRLAGCQTRVNKRWAACDMTGEVCFYDDTGGVWYEFSAYFVRGQLKHLEQTSPPHPQGD